MDAICDPPRYPDYIDQEGRIEMRFGKDILSYLTGLQREFTRYALSDVAKMTSAYGIRLYELLIQWKGGHRVVALDDLRRWVIEPAVEQINEHSPLILSWSPQKNGRKITHLVFDYVPKKPAKVVGKGTSKRKAGKISDAEIAKQARPGETPH